MAALAGGSLLAAGILTQQGRATAGPPPMRAEAPERDTPPPEIKPVAHPVATGTAAPAAAGLLAPPPPKPRQRMLEVGPGDTMMELLQQVGIDRGEAFRAVTALQDVYSPRDLKPGQRIHLALAAPEPAAADSRGEARLAELELRASAEQDVRLRRDADGEFVAEAVARELDRAVVAVAQDITASLFADGERAGVPVSVMMEMLSGFSYAVDFQRDLHPGDGFEALYETYSEADGDLAKVGALLYAALETRDKRLEMYRFRTDDGDVLYFDGKGHSVRRLLMRTPINGARLSSGYGMRRHPILGYSKMHRGVDFAAPTGTPIYAAGRGKVEYAGRNGSYGRYVRIRHDGPYKTAYAHLSRIAKGVHGGAWVSQGDVIGYVGSTGRSTGPHLHYEILVNGERVNPRDLDLPTGFKLRGAELARFNKEKARIDRLRQDAKATRVAQNVCGDAAAGC